MRMYTIYIDMSIGMYTYIKRCMHIYVHKRIYTYTCMYIYMDLGGYACAHVCILTFTYICILPLGDSRKAMNGCLGLTRDIYSNMYDTLTFEGITSSNPDYCVARLLCRWRDYSLFGQFWFLQNIATLPWDHLHAWCSFFNA